MSWGVATQNGVSVSLASIVSLSCGTTQFSPFDLFTSGTLGAWYDPSDYTTLYQDLLGTVVTAVEQPVGVVLDKSQGLTPGTPTIDGSFTSSANWSNIGVGGWSISGGQLIRSSGQVSTSQVNRTDGVSFVANNVYFVSINVISVTGTVEVKGNNGQTILSFTTPGVKSATFYNTTSVNAQIIGQTSATCVLDDLIIQKIAGNHIAQATTASRPVLRSRYNVLLATASLATQNVTTLATSYILTFTGSGTITLSGTNIGVYSAGTNTIICTAGTLTLTVIGTVTDADLRLSVTSISMPAYQRVTTATDYATAGFLPYLAFDGVDDSYGTGSINFTATDKMAVVAGVTKLSDAAQSVVAELSATIATNNGSFLLSAPNSAAANFNFSSKGTTQVDNTVTTYTAPYVAVLAGIGDIAGGTNSIKVNGGAATTVTSSQGTGNYGNYAMYVGRRNNATLPFNGRIYQMVVIGKALTADELANTEAYVNSKMGAY